MPTRAVYHVRPANDAWLVHMEGDSEPELRATRIDAVARARQLAAQYDTGRVLVHDERGAVAEEFAVQRGGGRPAAS